MNILGNSRFKITTYQMQSDKVQKEFRIALFSDLHNHEYGTGNYELVEAIRQSRPDLILMVGDMVNKDDDDLRVILELCENLKRIAPIYYTLGNHEGILMYGQNGSRITLDTQLIRMGVPVLYLGREDIVVRGNPVTLGVFPYPEKESDQLDMEEVQWFEESSGFRIMISHYPSIFYEKLQNVDAELAVAGHYHGGQVRLPFLGGLYHIDTGFFPRYSGGEYELEKAKLIVSRGLGGHTRIPRVNNRPELVLIDVVPAGGGQE
ncbi:MAG: serine/threonine protein phosphatase [Lachnospiraceae bacterium]|jgi:predicted MPP superfamily phosphohydrolase|nr:serine/threonine protein phosphatase [Lachnospiraceae bacterium]